MPGPSKLVLPDGSLPFPEKLTDHWVQQYRENRWLGLGDVSSIQTVNPFSLRTKDDIENPHVFLLNLMRQPEYFGFTCKVLFGKTLAPFQQAILRELWIRPFPMLLGCRGMGKSFLLAVYCMLRGMFNQGSKIVIVGAAFRQAKVVFDYCQELWESGPVFRDIVGPDKRNGPRRDVDRCTLRIGDSLIVALPLGDGCLAGSTLVTFGDGFASMSSEHTGEPAAIRNRERLVWSRNGFERSDEAYANGVKPTKRITTELGIVVEGTHNHRLRVLDGLEVVWRRLDEMKAGDRLLVDRSFRWHKGTERVGDDEAYAIGLMVGDGCWTNPYKLGYATKDEELINALRVGTGMDWPRSSETDPYHYGQNGKSQRSAWLARWEMKTARSGDKLIPPPILRASREVMSAFLSGLYDTDGHVQIGKDKGGITVGLTTTSERLARQVQYILLHYGIISSLRWRDRREEWATSYELLITGKNSKLFASLIGFRLSRKRQVLNQAVASAKRNTSCLDVVPHVSDEMCRIYIANRIDIDVADNQLKKLRPSDIKKKNGISRDLTTLFLNKFGHVNDPFIDTVRAMAQPGLYYDTVSSVVDAEAETYDIHVPVCHQYCANGFLSHNTKIRGQRANIVVGDEFASISKEIFETVIRGFAAVSMSPVEKYQQEMKNVALQELGLWTEAHENVESNTLLSNQTIISGTAYYSFNHFYEYWKQYKAIVESRGDRRKLVEVFNGEIPEKFNHRDYAVIRVPVTMLPPGFMDQKQIAQAKATIHCGTWAMEYGAIFATDSNGFFKRSLIESCVVGKNDAPIEQQSCGEVRFHAALRGQNGRHYVMAIDPASEQDNFSAVILECHADHRRIVHCWTTTRARYKAKVKRGLVHEGDFYAYTARKVRDLMRIFLVERLAIDSQGGGVAVIEALQDKQNLKGGERPLYPIIDPDDPQDTDGMSGDHVIEVIEFARADWVRDANHGMRKDFEDRALLFPQFDPAILALAFEDDKAAGRLKVDPADASVEKLYDTLEDCVMEIEDLKDELATIVHSQTGTSMRDRWDTPETKAAGGKKGRLRKDRYSALLMANMVGRTLQRAPKEAEYKAMGGFANELGRNNPVARTTGPMWMGPSWYTEQANRIGGGEGYGMVVKRKAR